MPYWSDDILVTESEIPYILVDTPAAWERCLKALRRAPRMAVDIEANSLYVYRERVCLIQISTDEDNFIIDPLAGFSLEGLGALFKDRSVEKVFHAVDYDLTLIKGLYGWELNALFDTMWAGRMLGFSQMGLAWFLETLYGISLSKKCQKADWGARPLTREKLVYACNDTCHLLRLRDDLGRQLEESGRMEEARETFHHLCQAPPSDRRFNPDDFWRLPGARSLPPRSQALLRALFIFRDKQAQRQDVPPFKVMSNHMLLALVHQASRWDGAPPARLEALPGIPGKLLDRYEKSLLKVMTGALNDPPPVYPVRQRNGSSGFWQRRESLMQWRKEEAQKRGVESDVILTRKILLEIAEKNPQNTPDLDEITSLGPWRRQQYGDAILATLKSTGSTLAK